MEMNQIPGTPGWISGKGKAGSSEIKKVEVTEAGKDTTVEVKPE